MYYLYYNYHMVVDDKVNNRLKKIFEDIKKQAETGVIKIEARDGIKWRYYTRFYCDIEGVLNANPNNKYPIIEIPNYDIFIKLIDKYLKYAEIFYSSDQDYYDLSKDEFDKKLVLNLIINATNFDFIKVYDYINKRTEMLKQDIGLGKFHLGEYQGCKIIGEILKNRSNIESPYSFNIYFEKDKENFMMPSILYGMTDKDASIMGIQNFNKERVGGELAKKLDRYFRKINKGIDMNDIISNVSPNALVSFTIFISYLKSLGIKDISASAFRPVRYHASKISGYLKYVESEKRKEFLQKHNHNQYNMTNKVLYMFLRYGHHFDNANVYYDDIMQKINLELTDKNPTENDNIIYQLSSSINNEHNDEYENN